VTTQRSAVLVGVGPGEEALFRRQLADVIDIVAVEQDVQRGAEVIRAWSPSVAMLYLDREPDTVLGIARQCTNGTAPVVVSRSRDSDKILQAMRSGARDFAYLEDEGHDLRRAVQSLTPVDVEPETAGGTVISVFSCKGGSGATTIATNLAGALAGQRVDGSPGRVILLDLDFQMGDVLAALDMQSSFGIWDLIQNIPRLDEALLNQSVPRHDSGVWALAQTDGPENADDITAEGISATIRKLRLHFDFIVIDGLRDFRDTALAALDASDSIILTMNQDVPALKNASRCLAIFRRLGYAQDRVKVVVNRFTRKGELGVDMIADALQHPVHATVSNDFPSVIEAINRGAVMVQSSPRNRVSRDINNLLPLVAKGDERPHRGSFIARLVRR
jgi:pilus assembly protein CpaE